MPSRATGVRPGYLLFVDGELGELQPQSPSGEAELESGPRYVVSVSGQSISDEPGFELGDRVLKPGWDAVSFWLRGRRAILSAHLDWNGLLCRTRTGSQRSSLRTICNLGGEVIC